MNNKFVKWPSIDQLRHAVREGREAVQWAGRDADGIPVFDRTKELPKIALTGTVKIHGTNAGINLHKDGGLYFQSRSKLLVNGDDNARIVNILGDRANEVRDFIGRLLDAAGVRQGTLETAVLFGEWFGSNIQSAVGVNGLPHTFAYFGLTLVDAEGNQTWVDTKNPELFEVEDESLRIFNVCKFGVYAAELDLAAPEKVQNELIDLTIAVETECPVAKYFGNTGIGEGIVWSGTIGDRHLIFKVKGEKHSASKVRTLAPVDTEKFEKIGELVESVVTENRLIQMTQWMTNELNVEITEKNTATFLRLVFADVQKEEADTIAASELPEKDLNRAISNKARIWYLNRCRQV